MTTIEKLRRDIKKSGYSYNEVKIYNVNGSGKELDGILVRAVWGIRNRNALKIASVEGIFEGNESMSYWNF